jgi:hypothetical protein
MKMLQMNRSKFCITKKIFRISPIIFAAIILLLSNGCKKEVPESLTMPVTNLTLAGATLNGSVNPNGLSTMVTFEYGVTTGYDSTVKASQNPVNGNGIINVSADISGLTLGTIYHYRVKSENSHWTAYSDDNEFAYGYPPSVTTSEVTYLSSDGITLNGKVNAWNSRAIVTFEYGTTTSYENSVMASQIEVTGDSITNVSTYISGMTPCLIYYFRVKAVNSFGTSYGSDSTFFYYSNSVLPVLTTISVSGITATTATTGGSIAYNGCPFTPATITERGFDYYYFRLPPKIGRPISLHKYIVGGAGIGNYSINLTGLIPSTNYYVRAYAKNSAGTFYGNTLSFKTLSLGK